MNSTRPMTADEAAAARCLCQPTKTLLDEFAMCFAPELIKRNTGCGTAWEHVAKDAYEAAKAMMNERNKHFPK